MATYPKWKMTCATEGTDLYVVQRSGIPDPTECRNGAGHSVSRVVFENRIPVTRMTSGELLSIKEMWHPNDIAGLRGFVCEVLDLEVSSRFSSGFEWPESSGRFFSLSDEAQRNWLSILAAPDAMSYPFHVFTLENEQGVRIANATTAIDLAKRAIAAKEKRLTAARNAKSEVLASFTKDEIYDAAAAYLDG